MNVRPRKAVWGLAIFVLALAASFPADASEWDRSEDGKHWMYFDDSGEAVLDEWIEDKGKTYYVDAKGYMKTGWVKNKDDGNKYYMGEDGAMYTSRYTPDGHYVDSDGVIAERFDQYRKEAKSQLKKATKKKSSNKSKSQTFFVMTDLNLDGYRDLVVMEAPLMLSEDMAADGNLLSQAGGRLVEVAVWEPEEEKFQVSAEFDLEDEGQTSALYLDPQGERGVWLEIAESNGEVRLFQMEYDSASFENLWSFTMELDDWDGAVYYVNGDSWERADWERELAQARQARGNIPLTGYLPVTDENITNQVDQIPTEEELKNLW